MYKELQNTINSLLSKGTRLDGRKPDEFREISIEKGVSKNAEGSARVKIGETEVLAGVKMEVSKPYPDTPDKGGIMVNVELTPLASPEFEVGPPGMYAIELARVTDRAVRESKCIDFHKLCITPGEAVWTVIIDIVPINDAGNLFDAAALGAAAAIMDAKLPLYKDGVLDYKSRTDESIPLTKDVPIGITVLRYGDKLIVDPTSDEEKVYDSRLTVGIQADGNLCSMQKGGEEAFTIEEMLEMMDLATVKATEIRKNL